MPVRLGVNTSWPAAVQQPADVAEPVGATPGAVDEDVGRHVDPSRPHPRGGSECRDQSRAGGVLPRQTSCAGPEGAAPRPAARIEAVPTEPPPNLTRFSGFADLYDANRPSAPARLGPLLARYAGVDRPVVVDLGCGTGLSSRWAAGWADRVIGIEPNDDMRAVAIAHGTPERRVPRRRQPRHRAGRRQRRRRGRRPGDALDGADVDARRGGPHPASGRRVRHRRRRLAAGERGGRRRGGVGRRAPAHPGARGPPGARPRRRRAAGADRRRRSRARRRRRPRRPAPQPHDAAATPARGRSAITCVGCRPAVTTCTAP